MQPSTNYYSGNDKSGSGLISASTTFDSEIKPLKVLLEFTAETAAMKPSVKINLAVLRRFNFLKMGRLKFLIKAVWCITD